MSVEVELRYRLNCAADVPEIMSDPSVKPLIQNGTEKVCILTALYYDTPDNWLHSHGIVYRVRYEDGKWIGTIKSNSQDAGALHEKNEYSIIATGPGPDLVIFAGSDIWPSIQPIANIDTKLQLIFKTSFTRQKAVLLLPYDSGTVVELAVDSGSIASGEKEEYFDFLELELLEGQKANMIKYGHELASKLNLAPEERSKYSMGANLYRSRNS